MKTLKTLLFLSLGIILVGCTNDQEEPITTAVTAGTLTGGPFSFTVDGVPDMVTNITLDASNLSGSLQTFVITDDSKNILGLPPNMQALEGVDFDGAGVGSCYIYHLAYEDGLSGLETGMNLDNLSGDFALSNFLMVIRSGLDAGTLVGGPYQFLVDGIPDMVTDISLDGTQLNGEMQTYVITDDMGGVLGLPPTLEAVLAVDFDGAGEGTCFIYHLTYSGTLMGLEAGMNVNDFQGEFDLSNSIEVNRVGLDAGVLSGGPYEFVVDGKVDNVTSISFDGANVNGEFSTFVITDADLNILGLPPTLEAVKGVDFDGAGAGVCLIWHLTYQEGLMGLEAGSNAAALSGTFALSNSIEVNRLALNAGKLEGGPYEFTVDGAPDMATGLSLDASGLNGSNQRFIITDADLNILGLPPTLEAAKGVDFDAAGEGICLIWHITYEDDIMGLEAGTNAGNLQGNFALSNSIMVTRNVLNAGALEGGPFMFTVDGTPDMVSGIALDDTDVNGSNQTYVITDDLGNILGLPPTLEAVEGVDFDGAGVGVCFIWHLTYGEGLMGLAPGMNTADLQGFYDFSNSIQVTRMAMAD